MRYWYAAGRFEALAGGYMPPRNWLPRVFYRLGHSAGLRARVKLARQ